MSEYMEQRASNWKAAIFDVDDNWAKMDNLPEFIKKVYWQPEICPTTGKEHRQVHVVTHRQVRLKQMTGWIAKTKWLAVLGQQHISNSIKYCSKDETRKDGAAPQVTEGKAYLQVHELLLTVARRAWYELKPFEWYVHTYGHNYAQLDKQYEQSRKWAAVAKYLVRDDLEWVSKLSNPVLEKLWNNFGGEFLRVAEEQDGGFIIEPPAPPAQDEAAEAAAEYFFLD